MTAYRTVSAPRPSAPSVSLAKPIRPRSSPVSRSIHQTLCWVGFALLWLLTTALLVLGVRAASVLGA